MTFAPKVTITTNRMTQAITRIERLGSALHRSSEDSGTRVLIY